LMEAIESRLWAPDLGTGVRTIVEEDA